MKIAIAILTFQTLLGGCIVHKNKAKKNYFTLLDASYQNWTAGIRGGGSGTEYYFKIKIATDESIVFDTTWINNKALKINVSKNTVGKISNTPPVILQNDTVILRSSVFNPSKDSPTYKQDNTTVTNAKPPIEYTGSALLRYYVNSKPYYFIIEDIRKTEGVNRP